MKIVSNTGPIIGLAEVDQLFLLKNLASEVLIPPMVYRELLGKVGIESDRIDRALNELLHVTELDPLEPATEVATSGLREGEKQPIGLASTVKGDILLSLDDRAGRKVSEQLNIRTLDLIGLLLLGKERRYPERLGVAET